MKLDHDLIRDVLLFIETNCTSSTSVDGTGIFATHSLDWRIIYEDDVLDCKYDMDDIKYCLVNLYEAGLIDARVWRAHGGYCDMEIKDLTWQGRAFVENITSDTIWAKTKDAVGGLGRVSLGVMAEAAGTIAAQWLSGHIH